MISKQTTLDLNGPVLSFIQQPQSVSICNGGSATFVGIATASFPTQDPPNLASNTGTLSYRWYAEGFGPLTDGSFRGSTIAGTATTTLTVTNATSPLSNGIRFYIGVDYVPSAYSQPSGSTVTVGTARSTGNAVNEILNSNSATLTVFPTISVSTQPSDRTVAQTRPATFTTLGALTDTSQGSISYRWQLNGNDLSDSSTVSGSGTPNLSISLPNVSINTVRARLTHPTACNSPILTNSANLIVVEPRDIITYENDASGTFVSQSIDLVNSSLRIDSSTTTANRSFVIFPTERNIRVRITLAAGAGQSRNGFRGGQGGLSVFEYTLKQNTEYVFKLGSAVQPTGGANGGGGGAFLYEKARLIAVCGGGGGAGTSARGGDGGGIGIGGESGLGRSGGIGGVRVANGQLPTATGFFPGGGTNPTDPGNTTAPTGGQVSGCTIGDYYAQIGFSPCQDVGQAKWVTSRGIIVQQTATIQRGFKNGTAFRNNGGNGSGNEGGGGSGTIGGNAAGGDGSGGGGSSGYTDGSITLISTQLGGNSTINAYAIIESLL
jgi:hypothetical protein